MDYLIFLGCYGPNLVAFAVFQVRHLQFESWRMYEKVPSGPVRESLIELMEQVEDWQV